MIFGLFVHPGTQTFFLWQQHAFGSQADSSSDNGEDEAEDEEDVEDSGSGGVSLQQRAAGKDFWQSNFAKRLAFGSACKRLFFVFWSRNLRVTLFSLPASAPGCSQAGGLS